MGIIHIQRGGSRGEVYVHVHADKSDLEECEAKAKAKGYEISKPIEYDYTRIAPNLLALLDEVAEKTAEVVLKGL